MINGAVIRCLGTARIRAEGLLNIDGGNACLDGPLGQMTMSNQKLRAILGGQIGRGCKEISEYDFNRLSQELASYLAQHVGQRIF